MAKRKRYTNAQRKAYYSGMGYRTAHDGKAIKFDSAATRASFAAGYKNGGKVIAKHPGKYPKLKK